MSVSDFPIFRDLSYLESDWSDLLERVAQRHFAPKIVRKQVKHDSEMTEWDISRIFRLFHFLRMNCGVDNERSNDELQKHALMLVTYPSPRSEALKFIRLRLDSAYATVDGRSLAQMFSSDLSDKTRLALRK